MFITFKPYNTEYNINAASITSFEYEEPRTVYYDENDDPIDQPRTVPASLKITTTEMVSDEVYDYSGRLLGAISVGRIYILSRDNATEVYEQLIAALAVR